MIVKNKVSSKVVLVVVYFYLMKKIIKSRVFSESLL